MWTWVSYVAVVRYVAVGELWGRGQAMWPAVWPWASCVAVDELCGRGQAVWPVGKLYVAGEVLCRWRTVWQWRAVRRWAVLGVWVGLGGKRWTNPEPARRATSPAQSDSFA